MGNEKQRTEITTDKDWINLYCRKCRRRLQRVSTLTEAKVEITCQECKTINCFVIAHEKIKN